MGAKLNKHQQNRFLKLIFLILASSICAFNFSCKSKPGESSLGKNLKEAVIDTVKPLVEEDTVDKLRIRLYKDTARIKAIPTGLPVTFDDPKMTFYDQAKFKGNDLILKARTNAYTGHELDGIAKNGIRSIIAPFGVCADILYNTNYFVRVPDYEKMPLPGTNPTKLLNLNVNKYYSPDYYESIDNNLLRPISITIYPWTDFYFSTDDPIVPGQISQVFISFSANEQGYTTEGGKIQLSGTSGYYTKSISYHIPVGRSINIWEATKNGDASWDYKIDPKTNILTVNLHVNNNGVLKPRNWIGVRASLK
jgi:hypothetical protein